MTSKFILPIPSIVLIFIFVSSSLFLNASDHSMDELIEGFRKVTVASVSDSVDQLTGRRGFMYHDMRPLSDELAALVGPAVTVLVVPEAAPEKSVGFTNALMAIDEAESGSVLVVQVKEDLNITGIGGLMATTCHARGLEGAVIDGAARDVDEINELGFPVFSRSISPSTAFGRYQAIGRQIPIECAGVPVRPGDLVVGGTDGVVVVPIEVASEVLSMAQEMDHKEAQMVPMIRQHKSILKAVEEFNRL